MYSKNRIYLCIDLKSFYASVECVERGLDAMTTNLVVADNCKISLRTVDNKIKAINLKIARLGIHD